MKDFKNLIAKSKKSQKGVDREKDLCYNATRKDKGVFEHVLEDALFPFSGKRALRIWTWQRRLCIYTKGVFAFIGFLKRIITCEKEI